MKEALAKIIAGIPTEADGVTCCKRDVERAFEDNAAVLAAAVRDQIVPKLRDFIEELRTEAKDYDRRARENADMYTKGRLTGLADGLRNTAVGLAGVVITRNDS